MSQRFDRNKIAIGKQKEFYRCDYITGFEMFKEKLPGKEKFYSLLTGKKLLTKNMIMFLMFWIHLKWKQWNIIAIWT